MWKTQCRPAQNQDGQWLHWGVSCDVTGMHPITGTRYHKIGQDYDLCEAEFLKLPDEEKALFEAIEHPQQGGCGMRRRCSPRGEAIPEGALLPAAGISRGAHGPGVAQLQNILIQAGFMDQRAVRFCMGMYGPRTTQAIAAIQQSLNLEPTGTFDDTVRTHLLSKLGVEAAPQEEAQLPVPE